MNNIALIYMFIYVATTAYYRSISVVKIGCTECPRNRLRTYLTGCPPGLTPSGDIVFDAIWETTAQTREELFDIEERIHDHFLQFRMMRAIPGDSEWFDFSCSAQSRNAVEMIAQFLSVMPMSARIKCRIAIDMCEQPSTRFLQQQVHKNFQFVARENERLARLNEIQAPIIAKLRDFIHLALTQVNAPRAGYIVMPCGSGKTVVICESLRHDCVARHTIICAPTCQIQAQWRETLISHACVAASNILIVGGSGTTDVEQIRAREDASSTLYIITTYASTHILAELITAVNTDLIIFDEAHHMSGIVSDEDEGEGCTRRLIKLAADQNIPRISLTYTPRFISRMRESEYLSMDNRQIFGERIIDVDLRSLITRGVLPDYHVWTLFDCARQGMGLIGKAECLLEAWRATEIVRGTVQPILHHLIVFARTINEAQQLETYLRAKCSLNDDVSLGAIFRAESGNVERVIKEFEAAPRAILVNCLVLGEGVDIPRANAVAIMYPKQSRTQITQMILRAGRWSPDKSLFHVLVPIAGDEDMSGFEEVLVSLAEHDSRIREEIIAQAEVASTQSTTNARLTISGMIPLHITIEECTSTDTARIRQCWLSIHRMILTDAEIALVRRICAEKHIDTSLDYALLRAKMPELPADPRPPGDSWFAFLHSGAHRISFEDFRALILAQNMLVGWKYDDWRRISNAIELPTCQHITDGYFAEIRDFNQMTPTSARMNR